MRLHELLRGLGAAALFSVMVMTAAAMAGCGERPGEEAESTSDSVTVSGCGGGGTVSIRSGALGLDYDLEAGTATFSSSGDAKIRDFYAGVELGSYVTSKDYPTHTCSTSGNTTTVTSSGGGYPTMKQSFITPGGNHILTQVTVEGEGLASAWMAPVVMSTKGGGDIGSTGDDRVLWVPFDNDAWVRYNAAPLSGASGTSFEVAAFYDDTSRQGLVVGSVTHDTWKTGVYYVGSNNKLDKLNVFGGATDPTWTHDVVAHGKVTGSTIRSPLVFLGFSADWRDLMEEFADANTANVARLPWSGGVPFGWNSWGKIQEKISYQDAVTVSNFIKTDLQSKFNDDGVVYVNLDSYWDNLSTSELESFVATCHQNGQKAGIYRAPFVDWSGVASRPVEGSNYTYGELWLRDAKGNPITLHGAWALDPTHPGTQAQIDTYIDEFKSLGFEYVKLDFLNFGALESTTRFDPSVTTGIQAYNQGMQHIVDRIAGTMFISESIAPLFPYQYGHARRVSCDTFGAAVGQTMSSEYELNSAAYGFWMNQHLYSFNDPDQMVFEGYSANANMTRLLSGVVTGTVFLDGDDLTEATGQGLAQKYLTNDAINAVARLGKAFRPVDGNSGDHAPDLLSMTDGTTTYVAVFNFGSASETRAVELGRVGLDSSRKYTVTDVWSGDVSSATGTLNVPLASQAGRLLALQ